MTYSTVLNRALLDGASLCILLTIVIVGSLLSSPLEWPSPNRTAD